MHLLRTVPIGVLLDHAEEVAGVGFQFALAYSESLKDVQAKRLPVVNAVARKQERYPETQRNGQVSEDLYCPFHREHIGKPGR